MKRLVLLFFLLFIVPAETHGVDLEDARLNRGIRNAETYSYMLLEKARQKNGNPEELLRQAAEYSPDLPAAISGGLSQ
jgi:hypothetical protein